MPLIKTRDGEIKKFRTIFSEDIEPKKKDKEQIENRSLLKAIFSSMSDAVITIDSEFKIMEANRSAKKICGVDIGMSRGKNFLGSISQCNQSCLEVIQKTIKDGDHLKGKRIECGFKKGHQQVVDISSSPLFDPECNFKGAVIIIRNTPSIMDHGKEQRERHPYQNIIGKSKKMQDIYRLLDDLADIDTTVLVTGESGTGKELVAKALHNAGHRSGKPFVTVNCSALAENLLESELFGHVKGAFTGAINKKEGRFQVANGGTILLDEIGDVSPVIQLKLLRVLQEKEFEPVGDTTPRKVDIRIIACTNKNLQICVQNGEFREDLYYRMKVVEVNLPPLRERKEDIPLLIDHFVNHFRIKSQKNITGVSDAVLFKFLDYSWPGNIRELEHVIERAFVICRHNVITLEHLPIEICDFQLPTVNRENLFRERNGHGKQEILAALKKTFWNRTKTAELLGISRQTLYRKIKQYNILENLC
ncbi:MAG: sigma 54-interacting transcriptional regulator [Proteobacteria bacterium]|nr:sigma 54-interacting transcriptional regulator [Pseudomonadota bacterium]